MALRIRKAHSPYAKPAYLIPANIIVDFKGCKMGSGTHPAKTHIDPNKVELARLCAEL